jgi:uncharacterized protein (TIGR00730 family)
MNISVFGGSNTSEADYEQAEYLGHLLGYAGHTVISGGYSGTMEAVSKGAVEAGAHVIGITCDGLEHWRPIATNRWVMEERRTRDLRERLAVLIDACDAAIAMPGGPGTLTEIALTWNLLLTESISSRPLIIVGQGWRDIFSLFFQSFDRFIPESQRRWLIFAADPDEAMKELQAFQTGSEVK